MPGITVTISQAEYDAMGVMTVTPEQWVQHAVESKARNLMDDLITGHTDKNVNKISQAEKETIISTVDLVAEKAKRRGK